VAPLDQANSDTSWHTAVPVQYFGPRARTTTCTRSAVSFAEELTTVSTSLRQTETVRARVSGDPLNPSTSTSLVEVANLPHTTIVPTPATTATKIATSHHHRRTPAR
jgi:hypothetical protein